MMKTFSIKPQNKEKTKEISCPVCHNVHFRDYWDCQDYSYVICRKCRLILQNPQPVFEALDNRYDEEYFQYEQNNDSLFFDLMLKGLEDVGFTPSAHRFGYNPAFLDIGCATGLLVKHMQDTGWISKGVELCGPAAEYGARVRGVDIFSGTVEQAAYPDQSFHVVHCSHLIEHLNDPEVFMKEIFRILKPGGLFFCVTPNADGLQARIFQEKWRSAIADHMFLFSRRTLKRLITNEKMSIEAIKTWGGLGKGYGPHWLKFILDRAAKKLGFGDVMILVSRKEG